MTPIQEEQRLPPKPPLAPFSPRGDIDYIPMSPLAIALRETYTPTEFKSKGLKRVLGVVAMIAIPFASPIISAAIAKSAFLGASATGVFSTWAGSAIVGAGLGAVTAKITGGDPLMGALGGAIGGGIGGLASSQVTNPAWMSSLGGAAAATDTASALSGGGGAAGSNLVPVAGGGLGVAPAVAPQTFMGALTGQLATTFTPELLAQQAIKLGGSIMMEAFVAEDYSEEQLALINKQKAIVDRLEAQGQEVDQIKLTEAKRLLQSALQISPAYVGRQNDIAMRNKYARTGQAAVRAASTAGLRPNMVANIERRTSLEGAAAGATGYEQGIIRGQQQQTALAEAGLGALPSVTPLAGYYTNIQNMYKDVQERDDEYLAGTQKFFGAGFAKEDEKKKNKTIAAE